PPATGCADMQPIADPLQEIARVLRRLQLTAVVLFPLWVVWLLSPILSPFVLGALLGWLRDPLADPLEPSRRSRNAAVILVFPAMTLVLVLFLLLLVPMIRDQIQTLIAAIPSYRGWVLSTAMPWLEARTGIDVSSWLDFSRVFDLIRENWDRAGGFASTALGYLSRSGFALVTFAANLVLLPVVTFFALRDWDLLVAKVASLIPRDHLATVKRLATESSDVLGGFLRGQFLVMLILGAMYGVGLWLVGLDLGLLIGIIAGLLTFVPYVGPASGVILGCVAALVQFGTWQHVAGVLV